MICDNLRQYRKISLNDYSERNRRFHYCCSLYVPDCPLLRLYLLKLHHESVVAGHSRLSKTLELLRHKYIWLGMWKDISQFV